MKITCESCGAHYDLDEAKVPAAGLTMKCPACLHQFLVRRPLSGGPPPPTLGREIELSSVEDDHTPLPEDAPGLVAPRTAVTGSTAFDEIDLPAPKMPKGRPAIQLMPPAGKSQKAPIEVEPTRDDGAISISLDTGALGGEPDDVIDLPAPVAQGSPRGGPQLEVIDLPAPKATPSPPKAAPPPPKIVPPPPKIVPPPPKIVPPAAAAPPPPPPSKAVPTSVSPPPRVPPNITASHNARTVHEKQSSQEQTAVDDLIDLPAPKGTPLAHISREDEAPDLLAPKRAGGAPRPSGPPPSMAPVSVPVDLDAPDPEDLDLVAPVKRGSPAPSLSSEPYDGPPSVDLESIDLVAPKHGGPSDDGSTDIDVVAPVAPKPLAETVLLPQGNKTADRSLDDPTPVEAQKLELPLTKPVLPPKNKAQAKQKVEDDEDERPKRRLPRVLMAVGGVVFLVGAVGVGLGVFTGQGYFGANLWNSHHKEDEVKLIAARKLLTDDTLASYLKAAVELRGLNENDLKNREAASLEAQAHLCAGRLGSSSETKAAEALLGKLTAGDAPEGKSQDLRKAQALRALVAGKPGDARGQLQALLTTAPADAVALVYLGWTELSVGDFAAADAAFAKALASEPTRVAALYGDGLAKERTGDPVAAQDLYTRALARSPTHFAALVGAARVGPPRQAKEKIDELISKRSAVAAPRELADAWTSLGVLAAEAGRRDEAEDRLKRALSLDGEMTAARVALARVQCDGGKCGEAVAPLGKIVGAQPKNLAARLALVRAQAESGASNDAGRTLEGAVAQAPRDPRVLYWEGRVQLLADPPERDKALGFFKDAVGGDPKYIAAYLAESNTFAQLGKADDALDALRQAENRASDDPGLMTELGRAYLQLGKAADAEARFRAALAKRPDLQLARMELGASLEAEDKPADAAIEYEAVAKAEPDYPGLAERQARLAVKQGKRDQAWELYQKALKAGVPTHAVRLAAAALALDTARVNESLELAASVVKEDERSAPGHLALARAQLALRRPEDALVEARRAATIADLPEAHLALGTALEALNKLDQAVQEYGLARRAPVEGEATLGRARILVRMGATRDALAELNNLAKDPKLRARALLLMGDCYADLQQPDKAKKSYEEAVKAGPDSGDAAFKLGRVYLDGGKRKPATEMLERALKLGGDKAPYAVEAWLLTGDAHRDSKENEAAVRAYKKYLELAPPEAPARLEVNKHLSLLGGN